MYIQGDPKKMSVSVYELKSVLDVGFYFPTCVLESEFWAWFISPLSQYPFRIRSALKIKKKNTCKDNHFPLAIWSAAKTLSSLHMHTPAALNKSVLAGTAIQAPQRNSRQQSPSFTLLLLPIYESETSRLVWGTVLVFDCDVSFIIPPYFQSPKKLF